MSAKWAASEGYGGQSVPGLSLASGGLLAIFGVSRCVEISPWYLSSFSHGALGVCVCVRFPPFIRIPVLLG